MFVPAWLKPQRSLVESWQNRRAIECNRDQTIVLQPLRSIKTFATPATRGFKRIGHRPAPFAM
jgi:hypothetical protein